MNAFSTVLLALAMSTDAFAAAIVKGAGSRRPGWREALRVGAIFGGIEATTPVVGWALGSVAAPYVEAWDHWIAFGLLAALGARMIRSGLRAVPEAAPARPERHPFWVLAATGLATSIDAMAVGAGLALVDVAILPVAAAIGLATFGMVTLGTQLGRALGSVAGRRAEVGGGVALVGIGVAILLAHLGAAA